MNMGKEKLLFVLIVFFIIVSTFYTIAEYSENKLAYNVDVNAVIIPVFAVNKKGDPVFDLKREDLVLYINGKPVDINSLSKYDFKSESEYQEKIPRKLLNKRKSTFQDRYIFIILDSVFNSRDGFRRTKSIAKKLIKKGLSPDKFVVLQIHPGKGLSYIGGPELKRNKLFEKIDSLKISFDGWSNDLFRQRMLGSNLSNSMYDYSQQELREFLKLAKISLKSERAQYKIMFYRYVSTLSKFKYVLKTIVRPKLVYLISEGVANGNFLVDSPSDEKMKKKGRGGRWSILWDDEKSEQFKKLYSGMMLNYLKDIVKSVNRGNSVLYSVNPAKPSDTFQPNVSGEMSLRYIAQESGGKYYTGMDQAKLVERITKNTSAYYELSFLIPTEMKGNLHVKVRCKRKDVRIDTVKYTELKKDYKDMDKLQKRVFAYNLAKGGKWSRLIATEVDEKIVPEKNDGEKSIIYRFSSPKAFKTIPVDLYVITEDLKRNDVKIREKKNILLKEIEEVKIKKRKNVRNFLVIMNPSESLYKLIELD